MTTEEKTMWENYTMTTEEKTMWENYTKMRETTKEENAKSLSAWIERTQARARSIAALRDLARPKNPDPEVANM